LKTLGTLLIVVGVACFAMVFTGLVALMAPIDTAAPSPASVASAVGAKMYLLVGAAAVCIIGGAVTLLRDIKTSRQRKREGTKTGIGKPIAVTLVAVTILGCMIFALFTYMTRWNPDKAWAAKVIGESAELQILLARYYEENGEYPEALDDIEEDYTRPTDFLSRNADPAGRSRWFYDRIGPNDYQLEVTAYSWVSYHDSLVYRHSGNFAEPWFDNRDARDWRDFGKWRYAKGFSRYDEMYYFDADGNFHRR